MKTNESKTIQLIKTDWDRVPIGIPTGYRTVNIQYDTKMWDIDPRLDTGYWIGNAGL